jgi:hypothetical protein
MYKNLENQKLDFLKTCNTVKDSPTGNKIQTQVIHLENKRIRMSMIPKWWTNKTQIKTHNITKIT